MTKKSFIFSSQKLSIIRNYRSASFEDIANALGVEPATVCQWESGEVKPSTQHIDDLAKFLNVQQLELTKSGGMFAASIVLAALENLDRENAHPKEKIRSLEAQEEMHQESVGNSKSHSFTFQISQGIWKRLQKSMVQAGYPDEDVDLYIQSLIAEDYRRKLRTKAQQNPLEFKGTKLDWQ